MQSLRASLAQTQKEIDQIGGGDYGADIPSVADFRAAIYGAMTDGAAMTGSGSDGYVDQATAQNIIAGTTLLAANGQPTKTELALAVGREMAAPYLKRFDPKTPGFHMYVAGPDVLTDFIGQGLTMSDVNSVYQDVSVPLQLFGSPTPGRYFINGYLAPIGWANPVYNHSPNDGVFINDTMANQQYFGMHETHMFDPGEVVTVNYRIDCVFILRRRRLRPKANIQRSIWKATICVPTFSGQPKSEGALESAK